MEFKRNSVYMNRIKTKAVTQLTLDEDCNLLETCKDIEQMIVDKAKISLNENKILNDKIKIQGILNFGILYNSRDEGKIENFIGEIPFEEMVNIEDIEEKDQIQVNWEIEDLRTQIINSRKINIKAVLTLTVNVYQLASVNIIREAASKEDFDSLYQTMDILQTVLQKKDTFRLKEEIELPSSKPNMNTLLFKSIELTGCRIKPLEHKLNIQGSLQLFFVYDGEENHIPIQWMERQVEFEGNIEVEESKETMIAWVETNLQNAELSIHPDYDGENRSLTLEAMLFLEIFLYEETPVKLLEDVYSPVCEMKTERIGEVFEHLRMRNSSRFKLAQRMKLEAGERILQICHSDGKVKIDEIAVISEGLLIEGILNINMLYVCADDKLPFKQIRGIFPFSHTVQAEGVKEDNLYQIRPEIEQLSAIMTDSEEVEIKASIVMDVLILEQKKENILTDIKVNPLPLNKMEQMPGIIGYIVKPEDTLWSIAKKFYASVSLIKEINELTNDELTPGERILLVKAVDELLIKEN